MRGLVDISKRTIVTLILLPLILLYVLPIHLFHWVTGKGIKEVR
jgi:hypothetical protein